MNARFNIHPDFHNIPRITLSANPWRLAAMNAAAEVLNAVRWAKYANFCSLEKIIGLDGHRIPAWIIRPPQVKSPAPALVYLHGGAFMLKQSPPHIDIAVKYARLAECCVILVDYRLAPQHPFPAAFNDCHAALIWTYQNAEKLGIDRARIALGGDSAGGALAASLAQKAVREGIRVCGQLLVYPMVDADCKSVSSTAFADVPPFKRLSMRTVWEAYLGHPLEERAAEYASPLHGQLTGVAPTYIETAEYDPLRDEGLAYAKALIANDVDVQLNETKGTVHGFDAMAPNSALSREAVARRVEFLKNIFAGGAQ